MPPPKRAASSHSDSSSSSSRCCNGDCCAAKKLKTTSKAEEGTNVAAPVFPISQQEPSLSAHVKDKDGPVSSDRKTILAALDSIKDDPSRVDVAETVFRLMTQLIGSNAQEDLLKDIIDADGITLAASIMKNHPNEEGLQEEGRALLNKLFERVEDKTEKDGIKVVLKVMVMLSHDVALQARCCEVLCETHHSFCEYRGESAGIQLIVSALEALIRIMAQSLVSTGGGEQNLMKHIMFAHGVVQMTALVMKNNPNEDGLQKEGSALLDLLFQTVIAKPEEDGIKAVLTVMKTLPDVVALQSRCCSVMYYVAGHGFREFVGETGGIPLIVSALEQHPDQEDMMDLGLGALAELTYLFEPNMKRVVAAGGIEVVVNTLKRHGRNVKMRNGVVVLVNLACLEDPIKPIFEARGHEEVVSFMEKHPQDPGVQIAGCWALANLLKFNLAGSRKQVVDDGAIPVVVKAMKHHPYNFKLQQKACLTLQRLAKGGKDIKKAMNDAGVRDALNAAIDTHRYDDYIKSLAKDAWISLVDAM